MIKLILLGKPPLLNATYKRGRNSFYKDKEQSGRQEIYAWQAREQYRGQPLIKELTITLHFYFQRVGTDWDSSIKGTLDSLQGIIFENDSQVIEAHIKKTIDKERPRVEITIS